MSDDKPLPPARPEPVPLDLAREDVLQVVGLRTYPGWARTPDGEGRPVVVAAMYVYDHATQRHKWVRLLLDGVQLPIWQASLTWGLHNAATQRPEEASLDRTDDTEPDAGTAAHHT